MSSPYDSKWGAVVSKAMAAFLNTRRRGNHDMWSGSTGSFLPSDTSRLSQTAAVEAQLLCCQQPGITARSSWTIVLPGHFPFSSSPIFAQCSPSTVFIYGYLGMSLSTLFLTHSGAADTAFLHGLTSGTSEWTRAGNPSQAGERRKGKDAFSEHILGTCLLVFFPTAADLP